MDDQPLRVATLTLADYVVIEADLERYWVPGREPMIHRLFIHQFGNLALVARDGDEIAGFLLGVRTSVDPQEGYVHVIGVRDDHRRQGVGAMLYARFRHAASTLGITVVSAIVRPDNEASLALHRSQGMTGSLVADYSGPGNDRIVFRGPAS